MDPIFSLASPFFSAGKIARTLLFFEKKKDGRRLRPSIELLSFISHLTSLFLSPSFKKEKAFIGHLRSSQNLKEDSYLVKEKHTQHTARL
jgi:hypothetical protein